MSTFSAAHFGDASALAWLTSVTSWVSWASRADVVPLPLPVPPPPEPPEPPVVGDVPGVPGGAVEPGAGVVSVRHGGALVAVVPVVAVEPGLVVAPRSAVPVAGGPPSVAPASEPESR